MAILLGACFPGRYHSQERTDSLDREPTPGRWCDRSAEVRRRQRDQAGDPRSEPDDAGASDLRFVGDLEEGQIQAVEGVTRIRDFDRGRRGTRPSNVSSLLKAL